MLNAVGVGAERLSNDGYGDARDSSVTLRFSAVVEPFIENWGTIADAFGMPRDTGRVHALVYLAPEPLPATAIASVLRLSPGACERHLSQLCTWGVVHRVLAVPHVPVYDAERDPWTWFIRTLQERRRHEFVPMLMSVRNVTAFAEDLMRNAGPAEREHARLLHARISQFSTFFEELAELLESLGRLGRGPLFRSVKLAARWVR